MSLSSEVRQFCSHHRLALNKNLGQHFLIDERVLEEIMQAAKVEAGSTVVEIGPGIGILTRELLKRSLKTIAIEIDQRMVPLLKIFTGNPSLLHIIQGDALHVRMPEQPYAVVANIPYAITSPLLRHLLLESNPRPRSMTLLIQREVAEKISDRENGGLLTLLVGLFGVARIETIVGRSAFLPEPAVDSAVLHIDCFREPLSKKEVVDMVLKLAKIAFHQKRKTLRNTIGHLAGGGEILTNAGIDHMRRPQTLSIQEWCALAENARSTEEKNATIEHL